MTKKFTPYAAFIIINALVYLFGSFVNCSLNIADWTIDGRIWAAVIGSICSIIGFAGIILYSEQ